MAIKKAKVKIKNQLTYDVIELQFKSENEFKFHAGQFITIKITDNSPTPCFRAYSISSAPKIENEFEICVKVMPGGRGSNGLNALKTDHEIEFIGPNGKFIFQSDPDKKILFIATGTGIAPFKSMIEDELNKGNKQKMHLLFGVRYIKDIIYKDFFEKLARKNKNFSFDLTISRPENKSWEKNKGRVTSILENMKIEKNNTDAYICGLNDMIKSVRKILKTKNLPENSIHFEKFD